MRQAAVEVPGRPMNRRSFVARSVVAAGLLAAATLYWPQRWRYIVVHHSAGDFGTIEFLQKVHRQRQGRDPVDAIPYHYVIGNGNGLAMGEIASDWRREFDIWGTHVSGNNAARNFLGIGICLVGNFEFAPVPQAQFDTLIALTRALIEEHGIPAENVSGHGMIEGESTKCPGRNFPMDDFKRALA